MKDLSYAFKSVKIIITFERSIWCI